MQLMLALNSKSSCLSLSNPGITDMCHHTSPPMDFNVTESEVHWYSIRFYVTTGLSKAVIY
jgi:hypothetical protein